MDSLLFFFYPKNWRLLANVFTTDLFLLYHTCRKEKIQMLMHKRENEDFRNRNKDMSLNLLLKMCDNVIPLN